MKPIESAALLALFFAATPALAFDEQREGFILGFGAGFHILKEDYPGTATGTWSRSAGGLATSLKIGAGITNQVAVYYVASFKFRVGNTSFQASDAT